MKAVEWRVLAQRDAAESAWWYARQGGLPLGERFLAQVDATLDVIARHPAAGSLRHAGVLPHLPGPLRFLPVTEFERHLVYYIELSTRVDVIRIWNSDRGLQALMAGTPDPARNPGSSSA